MNKISVKLIGTDGNAFALITKVSNALKWSGQPDAMETAEKFREEAMKGDYNHVLQTILKYVEVE
jgi:hypothetical protein